MIRIVLADDHEMVRAGFKMVLEQDGMCKVVGEAAEGGEAYALVARERPDILLLDVSMPPGRSGISVCDDVIRDFLEVRVIILTMYAEPEYLYYTLRSGARGYLLKNGSPSEVKEAIKSVMEGGVYIHPKMRDLLNADISPEAKNEMAQAQKLTARELEITQLLARGFTNKEIAAKLFLSVKTVEAHRSKIYNKLDFKSRAELVEFAIKHKLLQL